MNRAAKGQVRWNKRETGLNQTTLQTIMYPLWNLTVTALKQAWSESWKLWCTVYFKHFSNKRFDWGSALKKTTHCKITFYILTRGWMGFLKIFSDNLNQILVKIRQENMFLWKPKKWKKTDSCLGFLIPPPFYSQFSERIYNNYDSIFSQQKTVKNRKNSLKVNTPLMKSISTP